MSNIVHSSVGGFVVQQQPNVNAAYGPWDSLDEAKVFLQLHFLEVDENMHIAPNIPVGTTVAVYTDSSKQVISEYWWSKNDLIQKTFGGSQYTLKLEDKNQKSVRAITIKDGYENEPNYVKPITFKNDLLVDFGTVSYSIDGGSYVKYDPNTRAHADGIPTSSITQSLIIEWRDSDNLLLTYCDVPVHQLQNIVQEYYAYNNSEDKENAPEVAIYDVSSPSYLGIDWTPNVYGKSDWSLVPFGVEADNHVEWAVRRTRTNGLWSKLEGPYINRRWGVDGIVAVDKLILYYYSPELIEGKLDDEFSYDLEYLETYVPDDVVVTEDYTVVNTLTNTTRVWTPTYKSVDPYENRYCYVTQRYKGIREGKYEFGNWTTVALYTNFAVDGKDGDNIEYIYCLSKTDSLDTEATNLLNAINALHSTNGMNPGSEIIFDKWMWTDDPSGISPETPYEFCAKRDISKDHSGKIYGEFGKPFLWASFGKEGPDGPGLEYIYIATSSKSEIPTIDCSSKDSRGHNKELEDYLPKYIKESVVREWSDDPIAVTPSLPILWMSKRKSKRGIWQDFLEPPVVWNEFKYSYEIHLSNDNCAIPAAVDGTYSVAAALSATATKVEVRLGLETVDIKAEGITIECDKYIKKEGTDSYCLNDNTIVFDDDNPVYLAQFIAKKDGNVVATKTQSVFLNKGSSSYHLRCFPNSRMWYGGNLYSVNSFNVLVYVSDSDGAYYEVDDISKYIIRYQLARSSTVYEIKNITDHTISFLNETYDQDIYLQLYSEDGKKLLDDEVIDGIDYSKIKGKDHDGITIELNDQVNIPRSKLNNLEYIKNKTATRVVAYKSLKEYPIEDITVTAVACDAFETPLTVGYDEESKLYYLNSVMTGDVLMLYAVTILVGGERVTYDKVLNINVSNTLIDYELIPSIRHICYNKNVGCNVSHIFFTIRSGETDEKNQPIIPAHKIKWSIENLNEEAKDLTGDVFDTELINDYLVGCGGTLLTLSFELLVEDLRADCENIEFWCEPTLDGYNYTIDLSNPHLEIPKALNNSSFSNNLKSWTTTDIVVCLSGLKLTTNTNTYPHFKVDVINGGSFVAHDTSSSDTIHRIYFKPGIPLTTEQVNYKISVCERYGDNYIEFYRSQSVVFTDKEAYLLISRPTTINLNFADTVDFQYKPIILKMSYSGELTELTTREQLNAENLKLELDGEPYTLGTNFTIGKTRTDAIPVLLKDVNGYLYDYDDISLSRNGERGSDGISVEYIYGRVESGENNGILSKDKYEGDPIKTITKDDRTDVLWKAGVKVDSGLITWYDDPQGIDETHQQEFISVSRCENKTWSKFSTPKVHALFGKKGEDGNGVEYIYTACLTLYTQTVFENGDNSKAIGFKVTNDVYNDGSYTNGSEVLILGTHDKDGKLIVTNLDLDDLILQGWFDNIPDLSEEYPNLYMSSRKKVKGEWGPFKEPVLWNKYSTNLELILDNDLVIIDDNSVAKTIAELSSTEVKAYYKGLQVHGKVTAEVSTELAGSHLTSERDTTLSNKDVFYLKLNGLLSLNISGLVTYTFTYEGETITRKLTVHIKDFSVGEGYKLMLMPSVVNTENKDGKYSWNDTDVTFSVVKINGAESTNVDLSKSTDLTVAVYYDNEEIESNAGSGYTITGESSVDTRPDISFVLRKSNVDVDIQSAIFSSKGADGAPGVSPFVLNLTDDTDSVFVNNDTKAILKGDTTVEIYYKNVDLLTQNKLSWAADNTYDNTYRLNYNKKPFDGVEFQYNSNSHKMEYEIKKSFYKTVDSTQSIKLPIELLINYDGHKTTLNTTYHVNIFKDIVRREICCDNSIIKIIQQDDGSKKIIPSELPISIKEYNGNSYVNKTLTDLKDICKLEYKIDNDESFTPIDSLKSSLTIPPGITESLTLRLFDLQGTDDIEIDREIFPVITDGKIGSNGKSTAIRMRDKWVTGVEYYGGDKIDPTTGDNIYYTDVVAYGDESNFAFYQAKKYHTSSSENCPPNTDHWHKVAYSALTLTQLLLITNDSNGITGGFVDVEKALPNKTITDDGIVLWAGSLPNSDSYLSANNATFSVTRSGVIKASKGLFEGTYLSKDKDLSSFKVRSYIDPTYVLYVEVNTDDGTEWLDDDGYVYEGLSGTSGQIVAVIPPIVDFAEMSEIMVFPEKNYDEDKSTIRLSGITFPKYTAYYDSAGNEILANENIREFVISKYNNDSTSPLYKTKNPLKTTTGTQITSLNKSSFSNLHNDSKTGLAKILCNMASSLTYGEGNTRIIFPGIIYKRTDVPLYIRGKKPLVELPTGIMIDGAGENTVLLDSSIESLKTTNSYVANNLYAPSVQGRPGIGLSNFDSYLSEYEESPGYLSDSYLQTMFVDKDESFGIDWSLIDVNPSLAYYFYKGNSTKNSVLSIDLYLDMLYKLNAILLATKLQDFKYKTAKVYRLKTINIFGNVDVTGINFNLTKGNLQLNLNDSFNVCNISYALFRNSLINSPYTYMSFICQQVPLLAYDPKDLGSEYCKLYGYIKRYNISLITDDGYIYDYDNDQYWYSTFRSPKTSDDDAYEYLRFLSDISKLCIISSHSLKANSYISVNGSQQTIINTNFTTQYTDLGSIRKDSISYNSVTHNCLVEQLDGYEKVDLYWFLYKIEDYANAAIKNNIYDIECLVIAYVKKEELSSSKFKIFNVVSLTPYGYYLGCNFNGLETQVKNTLNTSPASVINLTIST